MELGGDPPLRREPAPARRLLPCDRPAPASALGRFASLQGKELSYNNLLDADAALVTARRVGPGTLTIVKHRIPSGIARARDGAEAFEKAWASDPVAGFGGVVAFTGVLDRAAAEALTSKFLEVVVAEEVDRRGPDGPREEAEPARPDRLAGARADSAARGEGDRRRPPRPGRRRRAGGRGDLEGRLPAAPDGR